jgi:hypothetical protein
MPAISRFRNMSTPATTLDLNACEVVSLRVTNAHRLTLRFQDGLVAQLDFEAPMTPDHGPLAAELSDPAKFALVTIDDGILTWPNGYDIDPVILRTWAERGYVD